MSNPIIRSMRRGDWPEVRATYEEGIATGDATFEQASPAWEQWDASHVESCRLVAEDDEGGSDAVGDGAGGGVIVGWAALSRVSERCVYGGVAEVSVYVASAARGRGIGRRLLTELIHKSERNGFWTLQAGIFPENVASVRLHERCGFRLVGRRERIGEVNGRWRDVLLMERRV